MSVLRFACLAVVSVWVGGMAALGGVAAPTIFSALEAQDTVNGRALGGLVFGAVFSRFEQVSWVLGGLLVLLLGARAALGPRPRRFGVQMWLASAMLAASLYTGLELVPRIDAIRRAATPSVASWPENDPRRIEFGRLHGWSNGLMGITLLAGVALIWLNGRE